MAEGNMAAGEDVAGLVPVDGLHIALTVAVLGVVICIGVWIVFHHIKDNEKVLMAVFEGGWILAILTAAIIILTTGVLTFAGKLDGSSAATILSAIAGYVLGSSTRRPGGAPLICQVTDMSK